MRPVQLEVVGFTAFRERTEVDFRGADLFALTGPTGSGKSSIIDALVFALYGAVPRYGDRRSVEPVITLGTVEARIRFDFTIGEDAYTAARVVRRTKQGATTKEARLEHDGKVVASGADEVTSAVEELLGLTYDHFVKAVVLPQGEFSRFLHDRPAKRQELLRELLDIGVYREVRDLANQRKGGAEGSVRAFAAELDSLGEVTEAAELDAASRLETLTALRSAVEKDMAMMKTLDQDVEKSKVTVAGVRSQDQKLREVHVPDGVADLAVRLRGADEGARAARALWNEQQAALTDHEAKVAALPEPSAIGQLLAAHEQRNRSKAAVEVLQGKAIVAAGEMQQAKEALSEVTNRLRVVQDTLENLRRAHAAHELAGALSVGDPCPVCGVPVATLPDPTEDPTLDAARANVEVLVRDQDTATRHATLAQTALTAVQTQFAVAKENLADLETSLRDVPSIDELSITLSAAQRGREELEAMRKAEQTARVAVTEAEQFRAALVAEEATAWKMFDTKRDIVAVLGPPSASRKDLALDWEALTRWADETGRRLGAEIEEIERHIGEAEKAADEHKNVLIEKLRSAGLEPREPLQDVVIEAVLGAESGLERVRKDLARARELTVQITERKEEVAVASTLVRHLNARSFEAWLLEEALVTLTVGANRLLGELSSGAYSLDVEKNDFVVIDHRNADQRRSVRTLSGGETFLVSLALALSLSEQLTAMSMHGTSKLESIFLDEGFGSLDQETLDVVASVVHELGATGRTVGLISHVADLAEQVPTRYLVTKDAQTSHVQRIDA